MFHDEIIAEIHRIREEYSRLFNHDLKAIFADLQMQQSQSGRKVVSLSSKRGFMRRLSVQAKNKDADGDAKDNEH